MQTFEISPGRVTAANGRMHWRLAPRQARPGRSFQTRNHIRGPAVGAWRGTSPTARIAILCNSLQFDSIPIRIGFVSDRIPVATHYPTG